MISARVKLIRKSRFPKIHVEPIISNRFVAACIAKGDRSGFVIVKIALWGAKRVGFPIHHPIYGDIYGSGPCKVGREYS